MKGTHNSAKWSVSYQLISIPLHAMQNILKIKWFKNQEVWATESIKTRRVIQKKTRRVIQKRKTVNVYFNKEAGERA